jgi:hypothetical protein
MPTQIPPQGGKTATPNQAIYDPAAFISQVPPQGKGQPGPTAVPTPMPTAVPPQGKGQPGMTPQQIGDMIRAMPNSPLASPNLGSGQPFVESPMYRPMQPGQTAQVPQPGYRSPVTQPKGPPLPYGHPGGTPKPGMMPQQPVIPGAQTLQQAYANIPPNAGRAPSAAQTGLAGLGSLPSGLATNLGNTLSNMPLDTSRPAYNNYLAQAQFAPGGMPSYEQWVQQRTAAQNPAQNPYAGFGSLPSGLATNLGNTLSNMPMNPNIYQ